MRSQIKPTRWLVGTGGPSDKVFMGTIYADIEAAKVERLSPNGEVIPPIPLYGPEAIAQLTAERDAARAVCDYVWLEIDTEGRPLLLELLIKEQGEQYEAAKEGGGDGK